MPLGLAAWFRGCGIKHATELDWWDEIRHPGSDVDLTFAPAQVTTAACRPRSCHTARKTWACLAHKGCLVYVS